MTSIGRSIAITDMKLNYWFTLLFILGLGSQNLYAQKQLSFQDSVHAFTISIDSTKGKHADYAVTSIDIQRIETGQNVQTIATDTFFFQGVYARTSGWEKVFTIEDMNFDGYKDIRLLSWLGTNFYTQYRCWLYDSDSGLFKEDTSMTKLYNPYFDPEEQFVHTYWRFGLNEFGHSIYQWQNDSLVLKASEVQYFPPEMRRKSLRVLSYMLDGVMREEEKWDDEDFGLGDVCKENCDLFQRLVK